jgi:hypothetical protein
MVFVPLVRVRFGSTWVTGAVNVWLASVPCRSDILTDREGRAAVDLGDDGGGRDAHDPRSEAHANDHAWNTCLTSAVGTQRGDHRAGSRGGVKIKTRLDTKGHRRAARLYEIHRSAAVVLNPAQELSGAIVGENINGRSSPCRPVMRPLRKFTAWPFWLVRIPPEVRWSAVDPWNASGTRQRS